jgi:hypothetical protein
MFNFQLFVFLFPLKLIFSRCYFKTVEISEGFISLAKIVSLFIGKNLTWSLLGNTFYQTDPRIRFINLTRKYVLSNWPANTFYQTDPQICRKIYQMQKTISWQLNQDEGIIGKRSMQPDRQEYCKWGCVATGAIWKKRCDLCDLKETLRPVRFERNVATCAIWKKRCDRCDLTETSPQIYKELSLFIFLPKTWNSSLCLFEKNKGILKYCLHSATEF